MAVNANVLSSDISRRNPQDEYELIQKIGSGTYGDVYKVFVYFSSSCYFVKFIRSLCIVTIVDEILRCYRCSYSTGQEAINEWSRSYQGY